MYETSCQSRFDPPQVYMCSPSWTLLPPPSFFYIFYNFYLSLFHLYVYFTLYLLIKVLHIYNFKQITKICWACLKYFYWWKIWSESFQSCSTTLLYHNQSLICVNGVYLTFIIFFLFFFFFKVFVFFYCVKSHII